jgi:hypothetical protein
MEISVIHFNALLMCLIVFPFNVPFGSSHFVCDFSFFRLAVREDRNNWKSATEQGLDVWNNGERSRKENFSDVFIQLLQTMFLLLKSFNVGNFSWMVEAFLAWSQVTAIFIYCWLIDTCEESWRESCETVMNKWSKGRWPKRVENWLAMDQKLCWWFLSCFEIEFWSDFKWIW